MPKQLCDSTRSAWKGMEIQTSTSTSSTSDKSNGDAYEALSDSIKPTRHPSNTQRIAPWLIYCTIVTTLLLLFTISFLAFLWYSKSSNPFWQKIVLGNWITISVTLSAIALRTAVTLQAGITTSMLASLVIEGAGVRLMDLPEVSIMIFSNSGPHTLLWSYMKQPKSGGLMLLLIMLTFSTLATQFSSTLLLSDVTLVPTVAAASDAHIAYGMDALGFKPLMSTPYWTQAMTQYPVFGEFRDPPKLEDEVDDTGTVIRSLLPIAEVNVRERLHYYRGPAFVFDARTVCVQPNFLSLHVRGDSEINSIPGFYGKVAPKHAVENSVFNMSGVAFDCRIPLCTNEIDTRCRTQTWSACSLGTEAGGLISAIDPTTNASLQHNMNLGRATHGYEYLWVANNENESWPVELGKGYLLFNLTTLTYPLYYNSFNHTHNDGPWAAFEIPRDELDFDPLRGLWSVSLGYNALPSSKYKQFQDFNVTLSRRDWRGEPTMGSKDITIREVEDDGSWSLLSSKRRVIKGYDTSNILKQLGVFRHSLSTEERDIMELTREELQVSITNAKAEFRPNLTSSTGERFEDFPGSFTGHFGQNSTFSWIIDAVEPASLYGVYRQLVLCPNCIDIGFTDDKLPKTFASALLATVFNDALNESGSPALALQAYFTSVLRIAYYTGIPLFNVQGNMTTISYVDRLIPASRRGFWSVMIIIAIHITTYIFISIAFLFNTKFSMVGNIWAIFSQVAHSNEVHFVLQGGTNKTDKEKARIYKNAHALGKRPPLRLVEKDGVVAFASIPVR